MAVLVLDAALSERPVTYELKRVSEFLRATRKLRDRQVQMKMVDKLVSLHPELKDFREYLQRRLRRSARESMTKLGRRRRALRKSLGQLNLIVRTPSVTSESNLALLRKFRELCREMESRNRAALRNGKDKAYHRARLAAKEVYYTGKMLCRFLPVKSAAWLRKVRSGLSDLGNARDNALLAQRLAKYCAKRKPERRRLRNARRLVLARSRRSRERWRQRFKRSP
jgi:CHAD domain-containing protein